MEDEDRRDCPHLTSQGSSSTTSCFRCTEDRSSATARSNIPSASSARPPVKGGSPAVRDLLILTSSLESSSLQGLTTGNATTSFVSFDSTTGTASNRNAQPVATGGSSSAGPAASTSTSSSFAVGDIWTIAKPTFLGKRDRTNTAISSLASKRARTVKRKMSILHHLVDDGDPLPGDFLWTSSLMQQFVNRLCQRDEVRSAKDFQQLCLKDETLRQVYIDLVQFKDFQQVIHRYTTFWRTLPALEGSLTGTFEERVNRIERIKIADNAHMKDMKDAWLIFVTHVVGLDNLVEMCKTLCDRTGKRKCIYLYGSASTGKSALVKLFISVYEDYEVGLITAEPQGGQFWLSNVADKAIRVFEEGVISFSGTGNAPTLKLLFEGSTNLSTDIKHGDKVPVLPAITLMTSNKHEVEQKKSTCITDTDIRAFRERQYCLEFKQLIERVEELSARGLNDKLYPPAHANLGAAVEKRMWQTALSHVWFHLNAKHPHFLESAARLQAVPEIVTFDD